MAAKRPSSIALTALLLVGGGGSLLAQDRAVVMIDPGHGGEQAGVRAGDVLEKDVALRAAFALGAAFVAGGYDVRLTRTGDYALANADRRAAAEGAGAAAMISLHFNGNADASRHGIEIYGNLEDARVADLAARLATELGRDGTPVVVEGRTAEFLRSPAVPTVMIEAGFLTHPVERRLITSAAYHHELAAAIVAATSRFLAPSP